MTPTAENALEIRHLNKSYGNLQVTRDVSLEVVVGQRHIIIGPNGAGKTSLLHQIGGQIRSSSGQIAFFGRDVSTLPPEARAKAGLARTFQKNTLFNRLTVFENVRLGVQAVFGNAFDIIRGAASRHVLNEKTERLIERMNLKSCAGTVLSRLSYGDVRQVEVAVALASEPKLLLLDEPTSGLSPSETREMIGIIRALPRDIAILMIEHDMEVVFSIADHITVLYYGEVIASGSPQTVASDERVQEVYLGTSL